MNLNLDYLTSVSIGLFIGSLILFLGRVLQLPVTGIILGVACSSLIASFLYNPSNKRNPKHRALRGTMASFLFCLIFSIFLTAYYVPKFSNLLGTADLSIGVSLIIILLFTVAGGIIAGTISGSIGSTFRDLFAIVNNEKKE